MSLIPTVSVRVARPFAPLLKCILCPLVCKITTDEIFCDNDNSESSERLWRETFAEARLVPKSRPCHDDDGHTNIVMARNPIVIDAKIFNYQVRQISENCKTNVRLPTFSPNCKLHFSTELCLSRHVPL